MRVRLVKIAGMDLRRFDFDHDLTWYVFLLNADETIYGRYGGRDAASAESRLSLKGLRFALDRALEVHRAPPAAAALAGKPQLAEDYAAARSHRGCIHCHNVNEFRRSDLKAAGNWDRESIWVYPLPENIGITLDVDGGNLVKSVADGSPAARTGLKPRDRLTRLNRLPVASFADATSALHRGPRAGSMPVEWTRNGQTQTGALELAIGWRKTNLTWRPSMLDILPSVPFNGEELSPAEKKALGLAAGRAAIRQDAEVHAILKTVGVAGGDILIGFDGKPINGTMRDLLGFVRRNYLVGDEITVNLLRDGKPKNLVLKLK